MDRHQHHEHLIQELTEQLEPLYTNSPQAIYLYLDDTHKSCSKKFADLLGYSSVTEWVENEFPVGDIAEEDRDRTIEAYMNASRELLCSTITGTLVSKDGKKIPSEITMVPLPYKDEVFVLHFISTKT